MTWFSDRETNFLDADVFKTIFDDHWEDFKKVHRRYDNEQYEVPVQKMLGCRDASNGYSEYVCMYCGRDRRKIPFSCKSCFCLSCAKQYVDNFVSQVSAMLHSGVIYRHIVLLDVRVFFCWLFRVPALQGFSSFLLIWVYSEKNAVRSWKARHFIILKSQGLKTWTSSINAARTIKAGIFPRAFQ